MDSSRQKHFHGYGWFRFSDIFLVGHFQFTYRSRC